MATWGLGRPGVEVEWREGTTGGKFVHTIAEVERHQGFELAQGRRETGGAPREFPGRQFPRPTASESSYGGVRRDCS